MQIKKYIFLFLTHFFFTFIYPTSIIQEAIVTSNRIEIIPDKQFQKDYLTNQHFWIEYADESIDLTQMDFSIITIPFLMAVMPVIWVSNKAYHIKSMDHDLFYALQKIKKTFQIFYPEISWNGKLIPDHLVKNSINFNYTAPLFEVGTLFSAGLDATCTALTHRNKKQLLITVWGSDVRIKDDQLWKHVYKKCNNYAKQYNQHHTWLKSNFISICKRTKLENITPTIKNWWAKTSQSLHYCGLVAPLLVHYNIPYLLIGSTLSVENPKPYSTHPMIDNYISYAGIKAYHDGYEFDRKRKIEHINSLCTNYTIPKPFIRVCWNNDHYGGNCNKCSKCLRTIIACIFAGIDYQSYGFQVSPTQFVNNARKHITKAHYLTPAYNWKLIQEKFNELLINHSPILADQTLHDFAVWLQKIDIYKKAYPGELFMNPEQRTLFEHWWKKFGDASKQKLEKFFAYKKEDNN